MVGLLIDQAGQFDVIRREVPGLQKARARRQDRRQGRLERMRKRSSTAFAAVPFGAPLPAALFSNERALHGNGRQGRRPPA
jgi:hypothetical protein